MCKYLARHGHSLIITARNLDKLKELAEDISAHHKGVEVNFCSADLGKPETMEEIITLSKDKGVDGVVLMPPRPSLMPSTLDPTKEFDLLNQAMKDSFTGPRYFLQKLLPSMEKSHLKSTVLVSGTSSKQPIPDPEWEPFNDIRTTWVGCIKSFSDRYGSRGYRFNTVSPGQVVTPTYVEKLKNEAKTRTIQYEQILREKAESAPLKKLASISSVVKTIYFLLKSKGTLETTANNIHIDGGAVRPYY